MVTVTEWTGREAVLLQSVMRRSIRDFAEHLGISPRTVTKWRRNASTVCRPEMQQILDAALAGCTPEERAAFYDRLTALEEGAAPQSDEAGAPAPCLVISHKFLPVHLGERLTPLYGSATPYPPGPGRLEQRVLPAEHSSAKASTLHLFAFGVVVVHLEEHRKVESLTELAVWRYRTYLQDRAWAGQRIAQLLDDDGAGEALAPEYVLSAYELREHGWSGRGVETALQLLATPSVLVNREDPDSPVPLGPDVEAERFAERWSHPEAVVFGGGVSIGVAGWSGVAYHPQAEERALSMADIVALELDAQALWALSSHILNMVEEGEDPVMPEPYGWRYLRGAHSRLTAARPTETAQHRVMREAVLSTSELPDRLRAAQEALREAAS